MSSLSPLSSAVIDTLHDRARPVVTNYELFRLLWDIYEHPERYPGKIIRRVKTPGASQYARVVYELGFERFLRPDADFGSFAVTETRVRVFRVAQVPDAAAEDIICLVDPFSYVSHLSAMQRYGLTVRQPTALSMSTPEPKLWARMRDNLIWLDYGFNPKDADLNYFQSLQSVAVADRVRDRQVHVHRTKTQFELQFVSGAHIRLIEIGSLFVQMLSDPHLCGGMAHVLETWEEHAELYLEAIVQAVDKAPADIIRVRAGYILSELLQIEDPRIEAWKRFAQRGGSRKLDPSRPYKPVFSENWMISLNV